MFEFWGTLLGLVLAVALAGFFSGVTGFGFNLLATPVLLIAYPAHTAVQISLILALAASFALLLAPRVARELDRDLLAMLTPWGLIGVPVGALLFVQIDPNILKAIIGAIIAAYAVLVLLARNFHWIRHRRLGRSAGLVSGALAASTGLSGPPIVMYIHAHRPTGPYFRANIAAYVAILSGISLLAHAAMGQMSLPTIGDSILLTPAALVGLGFGTITFAKIPPRLFDALILGILVLIGIGTLASTVM